jgi:hypothetical protein
MTEKERVGCFPYGLPRWADKRNYSDYTKFNNVKHSIIIFSLLTKDNPSTSTGRLHQSVPSNGTSMFFSLHLNEKSRTLTPSMDFSYNNSFNTLHSTGSATRLNTLTFDPYNRTPFRSTKTCLGCHARIPVHAIKSGLCQVCLILRIMKRMYDFIWFTIDVYLSLSMVGSMTQFPSTK